MSDTEKPLLHELLLKIQTELGWEDAASWSNYDFEKLSDVIFERTAVRLSVTTLKRIWGKVKYDSAPNISTLNALTRFAGYDDWRAFKQHHANESAPVIATDQSLMHRHQASHRRGRLVYISTGAAALIVLFVVLMSNDRFKRVKIDPADYQFEANKMLTVGVPNSVVFTYDASASPTDSVYIIQTWDMRRKTLVGKAGKNHSAIYYYPGYFRSKLMIDSTIVKTHDIQIATDGWLGLLEADYGVKPFYFPNKSIHKGGEIMVSDSLLAAANFAGKESDKLIRLFNQRDMGDLNSDAFEFETKIKLDYHDACHYTQVLIQLKDNIIIIPLCEKACVGDIGIYALGTGFESKTADLSGFGANLSEWTTLRVKGEGPKIHLFVNDTPAMTLTTTHAPAGVVGLQYRFQGAGRVKETWFKNSKTEKVYRF